MYGREFGNTTQTHQGVTPGSKGSSTGTTHTPPFHLSSRDARELCGGTSLPDKKKQSCVSRPRPNPSETKTRPTSSEEATSTLASTMISVHLAHLKPYTIRGKLHQRLLNLTSWLKFPYPRWTIQMKLNQELSHMSLIEW